MIRGGGSPRGNGWPIRKDLPGKCRIQISKHRLNMIRAENGDVVYLEQLKNPIESDATEKAMSKKCEGQLSSVKANSCSSYKGANRTTEMAQEDNNLCWNNLPSIILQEIYSYLSHNCRLRVSQVF